MIFCKKKKFNQSLNTYGNTKDSQSNSEQRVQLHHNTDLKQYYGDITIKTAWYWHKNRQEDQWIRIEDPKIKPHICNQQIFDKGAQNTQWRKDSLFNKCCWENWIPTWRRLKLDPGISPHIKINSSGSNTLT
jgi:hypothetical protein